MARAECFVSVVAPIANDSAIIGGFIADTLSVLREHYLNYELVLVDDGSNDDTVGRITVLLQQHECIRLIRLSRSFGVDIAISAGLESVIGDFVIVMLPHSDPPTLIPQIVAQTRQGAGIVFGVLTGSHGEGLPMKLGSAVFYWYCQHVLRLNVPTNAAVFRGLSRQAVNALIQIRGRCRYLPILSAQVGYESQSFLYQPFDPGGRRRRRGLADAANLAIDIITTASSHPLRFVTWLGVIASLLNGLYACYVIAVYVFKARVAEGWTTLSLENAAMFFFMFLILTVLSEYVGQILAQSENRPLYYVFEERNSAVQMADEGRRNVVMQSIRNDSLGGH